jgi:transcriptional regulator with XRE-family HTH domain
MNNIELKELRNKSKITQEELAKLCNVSLRTIQNWEGGNIEIPKSKEKMLDNIFKKIPNNTIYNSGDNSINTINNDLSNQLNELISIQKEYQAMIKEKDKQISDLLEIIKTKNA